MSYHHIRLTLTSKAVTHNGTRSGEEHFQDIMKYYLKQAWSRCLGRGNSSSPASQGAARGSLDHSLSLKEIRLTVNQKTWSQVKKSTLETLKTPLLSEGQLTCVWLGRQHWIFINLPSSRDLEALRNDHDPQSPEMDSGYKKCMWDQWRKAKAIPPSLRQFSQILPLENMFWNGEVRLWVTSKFQKLHAPSCAKGGKECPCSVR